MLSFRAVMRGAWVGAALALCVGVTSEAAAEGFTLNNACLEDREACLNALDPKPLPPAPVAARVAVADAGGPIVLSNRHVGMSREELVALGVVEPVPEAVEIAEDQPFRERSEPVPGPETAPAPEGEPEVGFTSCIETSVRAGNGLRESVRVCRAVFMNEASRP